MRAPVIALAAVLAFAAEVQAGGPAAIAPEPAPAAPATPEIYDWSGPYVGIGYAAASGDFDLGPLASPPIPATPRSLTSGDAVSLQAGYLFQRGSLVYGAELAISNVSGTGSELSPEEGVGQIIDLKARAGFAANRMLVYGVLGYTQIDWDAPSTEAFSENGPVFGVGLDFAASNRVTVGLEYLARRTSGRFDPPGRDYDLDVDTLSLRVGLRF